MFNVLVPKENCFTDCGLEAAAFGFEEGGDRTIDRSRLLVCTISSFMWVAGDKQLSGLGAVNSPQRYGAALEVDGFKFRMRQNRYPSFEKLAEVPGRVCGGELKMDQASS